MTREHVQMAYLSMPVVLGAVQRSLELLPIAFMSIAMLL